MTTRECLCSDPENCDELPPAGWTCRAGLIRPKLSTLRCVVHVRRRSPVSGCACEHCVAFRLEINRRQLQHGRVEVSRYCASLGCNRHTRSYGTDYCTHHRCQHPGRLPCKAERLLDSALCREHHDALMAASVLARHAGTKRTPGKRRIKMGDD